MFPQDLLPKCLALGIVAQPNYLVSPDFKEKGEGRKDVF